MTCFGCTCFGEAKGSNMKTRWNWFESKVIYSLILYKPNKNQAIGCCKNQRKEQNNKELSKKETALHHIFIPKSQQKKHS